jgi:hypothetical protein
MKKEQQFLSERGENGRLLLFSYWRRFSARQLHEFQRAD